MRTWQQHGRGADMARRHFLGTALALAGVAAAGAPDPRMLGAAGYAKIVCSAVFVSWIAARASTSGRGACVPSSSKRADRLPALRRRPAARQERHALLRRDLHGGDEIVLVARYHHTFASCSPGCHDRDGAYSRGIIASRSKSRAALTARALATRRAPRA
jgi:hypothetical protein